MEQALCTFTDLFIHGGHLTLGSFLQVFQTVSITNFADLTIRWNIKSKLNKLGLQVITTLLNNKDVMSVANYHLLIPSVAACRRVAYWVLCYF